MGLKKVRSTVSNAHEDKFILDTWEDLDLTGKVQQIQCGKCWKMVKSFFIRRRRTPMGSLVHDVECHKCHLLLH